MLILVSLLGVGPAHAGVTVETQPATDRSEASAHNRAARDAGYRGRVVRRFDDADGWTYLVRWSFDDAAEAVAATQALTKALEVELVVHGEEPDAGGDGVVVAPAAAEQPDPIADAIDRHGALGAPLTEAKTLRVTYTRAFPDGRVARHVFARRGTDMRVAIEPVEGDVAASVTVAIADAAWLELDGKKTAQDLQRSRETLAAFSPHAIIPLALDLDAAVREHPELAELEPKGTAKVDGATCAVLGSRNGDTMVALDEALLVRRVVAGGGQRAYEYHDHRDVGGSPIPHRITTHEGESLMHTVLIEKIEIGPGLPDAWFQPPS